MINIKLDKTGGLTEALALADEAKERGLSVMIGGMLGTSLAMAPAMVVAPACLYADLNAPQYLQHDRDHGITYTDGVMSMPSPALWG